MKTNSTPGSTLASPAVWSFCKTLTASVTSTDGGFSVLCRYGVLPSPGHDPVVSHTRACGEGSAWHGLALPPHLSCWIACRCWCKGCTRMTAVCSWRRPRSSGICSRSGCPPIEEVISSGVVPRFVQFLTREEYSQL